MRSSRAACEEFSCPATAAKWRRCDISTSFSLRSECR
jgi:hypothetical protein